jgi:hypothetical protein
MKKLLSVVPLLAVLVFAIGFNILRTYNARTRYCCVSKTFFGYHIEKGSLDNKGCNYFVYNLKHKGTCTIENWESGFCTWYMNR